MKLFFIVIAFSFYLCQVKAEENDINGTFLKNSTTVPTANGTNHNEDEGTKPILNLMKKYLNRFLVMIRGQSVTIPAKKGEVKDGKSRINYTIDDININGLFNLYLKEVGFVKGDGCLYGDLQFPKLVLKSDNHTLSGTVSNLHVINTSGPIKLQLTNVLVNVSICLGHNATQVALLKEFFFNFTYEKAQVTHENEVWKQDWLIAFVLEMYKGKIIKTFTEFLNLKLSVLTMTNLVKLISYVSTWVANVYSQIN